MRNGVGRTGKIEEEQLQAAKPVFISNEFDVVLGGHLNNVMTLVYQYHIELPGTGVDGRHEKGSVQWSSHNGHLVNA